MTETPEPTLTPGKQWGLRRLADEQGRFKMVALDQRPPMKQLVAQKRGSDQADPADLKALRQTLARILAPQASAVLLDPHGAYPACQHLISAHQGLLMTLEDSIFEVTDKGRRSYPIPHWSVPKIKRVGADAVKALAWFRPDADPEIIAHQQLFVAEIGKACRQYDIPFLFELLLYPLPGEDGQTAAYVEQAGKRPELVLQSVEMFAAPTYGVDVFKLESPVAAAAVPDPETGDGAAVEETRGWFRELGKLAGRPWVMLSAGAGMEPFRRVVAYACEAGASGYLAGRAIWWQAAQHFPDLAVMERELEEEGVAYMRAINHLADRWGQPWHAWPGRGEARDLQRYGERFRETYPDFAEAGEALRQDPASQGSVTREATR